MSDLPGKIGPYQVRRKLGTGGMGEVFLAYDERLDRQVAIKRIRSDMGISSEGQERFRREARLAAKLNHPAIIHIYDVLTEGDVNFIVMEHVEGTDLRQLLEDGPLTVAEAAAIGRDVAEGLAEAHRQGIVHRDLKSENVLVTPSGRAKITDFGIAKRLLQGEAKDSLTVQGHVLGTYRAMSPEQAMGKEVDHRSDLFSLGILLYEALTGKSPFEAENELAMLNRIIHDRQTSVRKVNPEVPEALSYLIDRLLEKDPLLRPRTAEEVSRSLGPPAGPSASGGDSTVTEGVSRRLPPLTAPRYRSRKPGLVLLLLLLVAAGGAMALFIFLPSREPIHLAVLRPEIEALSDSSADSEVLGAGIRMALVHSLLALEGISVKNLQDVDALSRPPSALARAVAADEVLSTRLQCRREICRVFLSRIRGDDGSVIKAKDFEIPVDDLSVAAGVVAAQVKYAYFDRTVRSGVPEIGAVDADIRELLSLRRRFNSRETSPEVVLQGLENLLRKAPRFLEAYLLEIEVARFRFFHSRDPEALRIAFRAAEQARRLDPEDPRALVGLFYAALEGGDLKLAANTLSQIERLAPGDTRVLELRAGLLLASGRTSEAIGLIQEEVRRRPSWKRLVTLGIHEFQQGDITAGRQHLEESLRLAPGNADALSALGALELQSGDPRRALELYQALVRRTPGFAERSNLGLSYFLLGRYAEAAEIFQRLVEQEPMNPWVALNLADTYLLMDRQREAETLYRKVLALIEQDRHASGPQFLTVKAQALAHLGQGLPAVSAVRQALRLAPENGPVAFEAAVVYALLGEKTSAMESASTALRHGCSTSWFNIPWFDSLRGSVEFQEMLSRSAGT